MGMKLEQTTSLGSAVGAHFAPLAIVIGFESCSANDDWVCSPTTTSFVSPAAAVNVQCCPIGSELIVPAFTGTANTVAAAAASSALERILSGSVAR